MLFRRTLITVSSREIIVVCGYMYYWTMISNSLFRIVRFSCPPFLKMAVVNTNVIISIKNCITLSSNVDDIGELDG